MAQVNLNIDDLKGFMNHIINNNRFLQGSGKLPVAVEVVGESGIGKTSTIVDLAKEHNLNFVKYSILSWINCGQTSSKHPTLCPNQRNEHRSSS
jgi:tetraacyldisaccharide-1-P 4'-kinase